MRYSQLIVVLLWGFFSGCGPNTRHSANQLSHDTISTTPPLTFDVLHDQKFKIEWNHGHIVVTVMAAWQGEEYHYPYILVSSGRSIPPPVTFKSNSTR